MARAQRPVLGGDGATLERGMDDTQGIGLASYAVMGTGYAGYATPQDMIAIRGSASKIVRISAFRLLISETTAALRRGFFLKRSTANVGGTPANPTPTPLDSLDGVATAQVAVYAALPSPLGTLIGSVSEASVLSTVLTSSGGAFSLYAALPLPSLITPLKPVTLRGVNEMLAFNLNGVALPAGFLASYELAWTESDA